jgi:predicted RNase H-like HicB family nuclease
MENYSLQLIWSDEKQGYVATVPEIPHLKSISETAEQAVNGINSAISAYLLEKKADREPVPLPRRLEEHSGQFRLRLPRALHAALVTDAENEGISLNTYIIYLLSRRHIQEQAFKQAAAAYGEEIRETMQFVHELVSNVTVTSPDTPTFSWRNDSSATIMQIQ